jgi:hypothetical protein
MVTLRARVTSNPLPRGERVGRRAQRGGRGEGQWPHLNGNCDLQQAAPPGPPRRPPPRPRFSLYRVSTPGMIATFSLPVAFSLPAVTVTVYSPDGTNLRPVEP